MTESGVPYEVGSYEGRVQAVAGLDETSSPDGTITLSTGVVIRPRRIGVMVLRRLSEKFPVPKPPTVEITQEGKTWFEQNPNDPDYLANVDAHDKVVGNRILDLMYLAGMDIVSIPPDLPAEGNDSWTYQLQVIGEPVPPVGTPARRIAWIEVVAIGDLDDFQRIQEVAMRFGNLTATQVKAAEDSFRSPGGGD